MRTVPIGGDIDGLAAGILQLQVLGIMIEAQTQEGLTRSDLHLAPGDGLGGAELLAVGQVRKAHVHQHEAGDEPDREIDTGEHAHPAVEDGEPPFPETQDAPSRGAQGLEPGRARPRNCARLVHGPRGRPPDHGCSAAFNAIRVRLSNVGSYVYTFDGAPGVRPGSAAKAGAAPLDRVNPRTASLVAPGAP